MTKATDRTINHSSTDLHAAATAIYKAKGNIAPEGNNNETFCGGLRKGLGKLLAMIASGLPPRVGFEGG